MAATNTGAKMKYNLAGRTSGIIRSYIIGASKTVTIGDFARLTVGFVQAAAAGERLLGVVVGIVDKNGINMDTSRYSLAQATWTSSTNTVVTGAANTTGDQVRALVDIDPYSVFSCEPDAAIGTTTTSNENSAFAGIYTDLIDKDEVDENNAAAAFTTIAQLVCYGLDPEDSTRGLYSIMEHQLVGG